MQEEIQKHQLVVFVIASFLIFPIVCSNILSVFVGSLMEERPNDLKIPNKVVRIEMSEQLSLVIIRSHCAFVFILLIEVTAEA